MYGSYKVRHDERYLKSYKAMSEMMTTNTLVKIKEAPPYSIELETPVLLNSLARASPDKKTGSYMFKENQPTEMKQNFANVKAIEETCVDAPRGLPCCHPLIPPALPFGIRPNRQL